MAVETYLNGVRITEIVQEGSVTHQHNRPSFATVRVPLDQVSGTWEAARLRIHADGVTLDFHGSLVLTEDQGDEDEMYRVATFADPTFIFEFRPARDGAASGDPGDFSKPSFISRNGTAPQMIQEILTQSIISGNPADAEGPMGIILGSFATGGTNLAGVPADWPMTIAQVITLLADTGELDVINLPINDGTNMGQISAYNGDYGTDRSGSVAFEYAIGAYNARACSYVRDYRDLMNKLWIYGGPRQLTARDAQGDQHWKFNVTADDPGLDEAPFGAKQPTIEAAIAASRSLHYVRMLIRIFDAASQTEGAASRNLYRGWWQMESWLRARARTLVHVTPDRGIAPAFRTGDLIRVAAGSSFGGGFSGTQRVMEYTYRWTADGPIELGEPVGRSGVPAVVTTADAEGI